MGRTRSQQFGDSLLVVAAVAILPAFPIFFLAYMARALPQLLPVALGWLTVVVFGVLGRANLLPIPDAPAVAICKRCGAALERDTVHSLRGDCPCCGGPREKA